MFSVTVVAWVVTLLFLWPAALYVCGVLKDPFHPFILFGALGFVIAPYRVITNLYPALVFVSENSIRYYLLVAGVSAIGFYCGFWFYQRRYERRRELQLPEVDVRYSAGWLFTFGMVYIAIGLTSYAFTGYEYVASGYVRDWIILWMVGFILILQSVILDRRYLLPGIILMAAALYPPLDRFASYGQRGDTFRVACLAIPAFLLLRKRPGRAFFIPAAICLALVLSVLERTRGMVGEGEYPNRVAALIHVLPDFFKKKTENYNGAEEFIYGAATIDAVRDEKNYNCGRFVLDLAVRFLPKEYFDKEPLYSPWARTKDFATTSEHSGFQISAGSMSSGFAAMFVEFWWFSPIFWAGLGYWIAAQYRRSASSRLDSQTYFTVTFVVLLYLVSQDQYDWLLNLVYMSVPAWFAYRFARVFIPAEVQSEVVIEESDQHAPVAG